MNDIELKVYRSKTVPPEVMETAKGTINDALYLNGLYGYGGTSIGTLLYIDADIDPIITPYRTAAFDYVLRFMHRVVMIPNPSPPPAPAMIPATWNDFYDPGQRRVERSVVDKDRRISIYVQRFSVLVP